MTVAAETRASISFVIPVRDDEARLKRCLTSIAQNDYPRDLVEVVVIDNGSADRSVHVAREAGAIVLAMPQARVAELRNAGARAARGEILAFVDADHEIDSRWLRHAASILSDERIAAAGAPYLAPADGTWVQRWYDAMRTRPRAPQRVDWLGGGNMAVRRDSFESAGGFDTTLETCEDVDLCNRLRTAGRHVVSDPGLLTVHFGDPATLRALFFGELWRGRDNLRVTLRGPWTLRHLRSVLIPVIDLVAIGTCLVAMMAGAVGPAAAAGFVSITLAALRASRMVRRDPRPTATGIGHACVVAAVYDLARALALLTRTSHRSRRVAGSPRHVVTADPRS